MSGTTTGKVPPGLAKTHTLLTTISKGIERLVLIEQEGLRAERIQARAAREERVPNYAGTGADAYRFARGYLAPPGSLAGGRLEVPGHLGGPGLAGGPLPFPPGLGNFAPLPIAPPSAGPVLPSPTGAGGSQDHTLINYGTINVDLEDDEEAGGLVLDVLGVGSRGLRP